jgi:hypothetical protein
MILAGIPISEEQCIGESLPILNNAFITLSSNWFPGSIEDSNKAPNGWLKTHTGVEIRWGTYTIATGNSTASVQFSKTFPSTVFGIFPSNPSNASVFVCPRNITATGFLLSANNETSIDASGYYIAIGV